MKLSKVIFSIGFFCVLSFAVVGCGSCASKNKKTSSSTDTVTRDTALSALTLSVGTLSPTFTADTLAYTVTDISFLTNSLTVTPKTKDSGATITVNGTKVKSGAASDAIALDVGDTVITVVISSADTSTSTTYTITVTIDISELYIKASNTETLDYFGYSVSIDGDTMVVGAYGGESAYVFVRDGTAWTQQAHLTASNADGADYFGVSVAIDGNTIVVGALFEDSNATGVDGNEDNNSVLNSGAAYVFVREGTTWSQEAYLKASNTETLDWFGNSVSIDGDTIVVGARNEDSNATGVGTNSTDNSAADSGAAYVFVREGTTWSQQAYLKASNTDSGDYFGHLVSIDGDTIVVGAIQEDGSVTVINGADDDLTSNSGAAYVFVRSGTTWSQEAYLKASNTDAGDEFGTSVAISGDTIVVGARNEDSNATGVDGNEDNNSVLNSGAAYVFVREGTTWSQEAYLKASNTETLDWFGNSVSIDGDTIVVGAYLEDSNATGVGTNSTDNSAAYSGAAYVFVREGTTWSQEAYLKASNTETLDYFGNSVSIDGDTIVVGALFEDSNATGVNGNEDDNSAENSGAAYVFE